MVDVKSQSANFFDVVIIGAGISGIGSAYRVQSQLPEYTYTILESRDAIGGTWDLFRYPGIRSDSDLHTFGFPWRPWPGQNAIASGDSILKYMKECAAEYGIDGKIQFQKKVTSANWSHDQQLWQLTVNASGGREVYNSKFLIVGTGYFDYQTPRSTIIPGLENFKGTIVHPQFWPEDLDVTDKKVVIIGSGATAVTLLPRIAEKASLVTQLQRSPSYVSSRPTSDPIDNFFHKWLPKPLAYFLKRWKNILGSYAIYYFCIYAPTQAKAAIKKSTIAELPPTMSHSHFEPAYDPWNQRFCICPNGDFFAALRSGKGTIVTDTIKTMTSNHIILSSKQELEADIIVTATGLKILMAGGISISINNTPVRACEKLMWKGTMAQDVPNAFFMVGYTNASWTLGMDAAALLSCRIMKKIISQGLTSVVPNPEEAISKGMKVQQLMRLSSTYLQEKGAQEQMLKAGDRYPWMSRNNYLSDYWNAMFGEIREGLVYERVAT